MPTITAIPLFNNTFTNETYYPLIKLGENKLSFCLRECYYTIAPEILKTTGINELFILAVASTLIGGFMAEMLLRKLKNQYPDLAKDIKFKHLTFIITLIWFFSGLVLAGVLKFKLGFIV